MTEQSKNVSECVGRVSAVFERVHQRVNEWAPPVLEALKQPNISVDELDTVVKRLVSPELTSNTDELIGAGVVVAPNLLSDAPWHLAWWLGERNTFEATPGAPAVRPLLTVDDPNAEGFRDYTTLEWWRVPAETKHMHITGPYVDYLCTDDYTMTLTVPLYIDSVLVGVIGADQYVTDIERKVLPIMDSAHAPLTLINAFGRVVLSTDPNTATGTLLRSEGLAAAIASQQDEVVLSNGDTVYRCSDTTLSIVQHAE